MDHKRARIPDIGEHGKKLQRGRDLVGRVIPALEAEGENRACAFGRVCLEPLVVLVAFKPGIGNPGDLLVALQMPRDGKRILAMALHAQRQGFDARQHQKRIERRKRRADVAQRKNAHGNGE